MMFWGDTMLIDFIKKLVLSKLFETGNALPVLISHFTKEPEYVPPMMTEGS